MTRNIFETVYHSFCRINQMQKPLYLIDIAKLDRYREKALGRYEGVPNIFHFNETKIFWRHPVFFIFIKCKMLHKELWRSLEVWRLPLQKVPCVASSTSYLFQNLILWLDWTIGKIIKHLLLRISVITSLFNFQPKFHHLNSKCKTNFYNYFASLFEQ